jgi:hypothetical protein
VWYEDLVSLGEKYQLAAKLELRGVGFYCASGSWPDRVMGSDAAIAAMWTSVRENFLQQPSGAANPRSSQRPPHWIGVGYGRDHDRAANTVTFAMVELLPEPCSLSP